MPDLDVARLVRTERAIDVPLRAPLDGSALNFFWSTGVGILSDFRTFQAVENVTIRGGPIIQGPSLGSGQLHRLRTG